MKRKLGIHYHSLVEEPIPKEPKSPHLHTFLECFLCEELTCDCDSNSCKKCDCVVCNECMNECAKCSELICDLCAKTNSCLLCHNIWCDNCLNDNLSSTIEENVCLKCDILKVVPLMFGNELSRSNYKLDCVIHCQQ